MMKINLFSLMKF